MLLLERHSESVRFVQIESGVGLVVRVAAWDPRVLSSSPVGR